MMSMETLRIWENGGKVKGSILNMYLASDSPDGSWRGEIGGDVSMTGDSALARPGGDWGVQFLPATWLSLKAPRRDGVDGRTGHQAGDLRWAASLPLRTKRNWMKGFLISKPTWRPKEQPWARPRSFSLSMPCLLFPTPWYTRLLKNSSR